MKLISIPIAGAYLIEMEPHFDERGFFARTWSAEVFKSLGLDPQLAECSVSFNKRRGTLRGMHYQQEPYSEVKLVRCSAGVMYDVLVDLRPASPTYCKWFAAELTAENHKMLYVPTGIAHGFQTLTDGVEVIYHISQPYRSESARGVRWNDPLFGIEWPIQDPILSDRDRAHPDFHR